MGRRSAGTFTGVAVLLALAGSAVAETEIPLPRGAVAMPGGPHHVQLGSRALEVESFVIDMDEEALASFYEEALPQSGWRLESLPWQARHNQTTAHLEQALSDHRDAPTAEQMEDRLETMRRTQEAMRRQLYASRGREHVIVNLMPMGDTMAIFLNRWSGDRSWMRGYRLASSTAGSSFVANPAVQTDPSKAVYRSALRPGPSAKGVTPASPATDVAVDRQADPTTQDVGVGERSFPGTNVCCSAEEVPELGETLPFAVPRYPGARALAQSSPQSGQSTVMLLMTPDAAEEVAAYYRQQMPPHGWEPLNEQRQFVGPKTEALLLRYHQSDRVCDITIQGASSRPVQATVQQAAAGEKAQTTVTVSVASRSSVGRRSFR